VALQGDGHDEVGLCRRGCGHRDKVGDAAVDEQSSVDREWGDQAGDADGGAYGAIQGASIEPDLSSGEQVYRHSGTPHGQVHGQVFDPLFADEFAEPGDDPFRADHSG
jgi:hypothetical protein